MLSLASNCGQMAPNGTNLGIFKISFSKFWLLLKLILKSPRFVPFGTNLTQFVCQICHPCWLYEMTTWLFVVPDGNLFTNIKTSLSSGPEVKTQTPTSHVRPTQCCQVLLQSGSDWPGEPKRTDIRSEKILRFFFH